MNETIAQASPAVDPNTAADAIAANAPDTVEQAVRVDPAFVLSKIETWVVGFQQLLPNIVVAIVVFAVAFGIGWSIERSFRSWADKHERANLGAVLGSFLKWIVLLFGSLLALTIVIPSLNPGDLLAGLGIGSVAIGFAFKDILQNWLAGLLILIQRPFDVGDQIIVDGFEGTVEWIETRATIIILFDGRRVIIPNASVYSSSVTVNTARPLRRSQYDVGIGYGDNVEMARGHPGGDREGRGGGRRPGTGGHRDRPRRLQRQPPDTLVDAVQGLQPRHGPGRGAGRNQARAGREGDRHSLRHPGHPLPRPDGGGRRPPRRTARGLAAPTGHAPVGAASAPRTA